MALPVTCHHCKEVIVLGATVQMTDVTWWAPYADDPGVCAVSTVGHVPAPAVGAVYEKPPHRGLVFMGGHGR